MEKQTISVQELSTQLGISLPKAYELVKTCLLYTSYAVISAAHI